MRTENKLSSSLPHHGGSDQLNPVLHVNNGADTMSQVTWMVHSTLFDDQHQVES